MSAEVMWDKMQQVYHRRGYLVFGRASACQIGYQITKVEHQGAIVTLPQPFAVVGETTLSEYLAQFAKPFRTEGKYFYRVVTE